MRAVAFSLGLGLFAAAPAIAADQTCARGEDVRVIEVMTPGEVGAACDLRYVREAGASVSIPYHADNDSNFCSERARALVKSLVDAGFTCAPHTRAPELREVRAREFDIEDILAGAEPMEPVQATLAESPLPAQQLETLTQPVLTPQVETAAPAAVASVAPPEAEELPPAPVAAQRGPTALTPASGASDTSPPRPTQSVGRLAGALPEERAPPPPVSEPAQTLAASPPGASLPVVGATSAAAPMRVRPAADLIRAVLSAQAAAWNDGDLDSFMAGYWKSPNLRFVSGSTVTKGWEPTMKRYRERYPAGGMGRLAFDALDVQMLGDDVAVVTGRFALARDNRRDSGAFTLVMQRFDGLWRIVHDHTVADPVPATE